MTQTEIIVAILSELRKISSTPHLATAVGEEPFELPQWISAGAGASLIINRKISDLIWNLACAQYDAQPAIGKAISRVDWAGIVRRVIGPLLANTDLDHEFEDIAPALLTNLSRELTTTKWNYNERTFIFGCSFIEHHEVAPFKIGKVTIWKREKWLNQARANGQVSKISHRRMLAHFAGKPIKKRKGSSDSASENAVADAIGEAPYVCAVTTDGIFGDIAKEKAMMAARFALLGVALMWESPTKAISKLNLIFDGNPYRQTYAYFQERPEIFGGSKWVHSLHGISIFAEAWETMIQRREDWWRTLAEVISYWLSADGSVSRPKLMNQLAQALIWFHEACREPMPMIATTKFMAALDALACGGKGRGIKSLITSRLGVAESDPIGPGMPTFASVVDELYSQGRSRLIHGSSDRVGYDWQGQRGLAESLARVTLISCLHWAADYPNVDDPILMSRAETS